MSIASPDLSSLSSNVSAGYQAGEAVGNMLGVPVVGGVVGAVAGGGATVGGFDIMQALGLKPKGSGDTEYVQNVNRVVSEEYDLAQKAINSTRDVATQQQIASEWKAELAKWGDLNNPSRNVAQPDAFKSSMQSYIDKANQQGAQAGVFTLNDVLATLGINRNTSVPISNQTASTGSLPVVVQSQSQPNWSVIIGIGVLFLAFILLVVKK